MKRLSRISLLLLCLLTLSVGGATAQEVTAMRVNEKVWGMRNANKEEKPIVIDQLFERCYWFAHPFYAHIKSDEIADIGVYDGKPEFYIFAFGRNLKKIETHTLYLPDDGFEDVPRSHYLSTRHLASLTLLASNGRDLLTIFDDKMGDILWLTPLTITDVLAEIAYYTYRDDYILPPTARLAPHPIGRAGLLAVKPRKIRKY
ncbi:MAG: hypothetical protein J6U52_05105 [Alistipes sp.]|nr:hypothetical protein [Alistipes sp.]